ncbi:hypothetical protein GPECTOR_23g106 [Gonium pectorale]|uniref:Guanylate cyclase domain-containing protein n=1 Tax=Gonium pectorale TaxID=33097 RepID=A0A150GGQ2_GONPE|nr:hypothetical protein GPECTOR_23g106 [Gonium pectorale]|eukprot:KXZ49017.1 hypothetical protein GPECTOR_23g106 [Gonium pectorale]
MRACRAAYKGAYCSIRHVVAQGLPLGARHVEVTTCVLLPQPGRRVPGVLLQLRLARPDLQPSPPPIARPGTVLMVQREASSQHLPGLAPSPSPSIRPSHSPSGKRSPRSISARSVLARARTAPEVDASVASASIGVGGADATAAGAVERAMVVVPRVPSMLMAHGMQGRMSSITAAGNRSPHAAAARGRLAAAARSVAAEVLPASVIVLAYGRGSSLESVAYLNGQARKYLCLGTLNDDLMVAGGLLRRQASNALADLPARAILAAILRHEQPHIVRQLHRGAASEKGFTGTIRVPAFVDAAALCARDKAATDSEWETTDEDVSFRGSGRGRAPSGRGGGRGAWGGRGSVSGLGGEGEEARPMELGLDGDGGDTAEVQRTTLHTISDISEQTTVEMSGTANGMTGGGGAYASTTGMAAGQGSQHQRNYDRPTSSRTGSAVTDRGMRQPPLAMAGRAQSLRPVYGSSRWGSRGRRHSVYRSVEPPPADYLGVELRGLSRAVLSLHGDLLRPSSAASAAFLNGRSGTGGASASTPPRPASNAHAAGQRMISAAGIARAGGGEGGASASARVRSVTAGLSHVSVALPGGGSADPLGRSAGRGKKKALRREASVAMGQIAKWLDAMRALEAPLLGGGVPEGAMEGGPEHKALAAAAPPMAPGAAEAMHVVQARLAKAEAAAAAVNGGRGGGALDCIDSTQLDSQDIYLPLYRMETGQSMGLTLLPESGGSGMYAAAAAAASVAAATTNSPTPTVDTAAGKPVPTADATARPASPACRLPVSCDSDGGGGGGLSQLCVSGQSTGGNPGSNVVVVCESPSLGKGRVPMPPSDGAPAGAAPALAAGSAAGADASGADARPGPQPRASPAATRRWAPPLLRTLTGTVGASPCVPAAASGALSARGGASPPHLNKLLRAYRTEYDSLRTPSQRSPLSGSCNGSVNGAGGAASQRPARRSGRSSAAASPTGAAAHGHGMQLAGRQHSWRGLAMNQSALSSGQVPMLAPLKRTHSATPSVWQHALPGGDGDGGGGSGGGGAPAQEPPPPPPATAARAPPEAQARVPPGGGASRGGGARGGDGGGADGGGSGGDGGGGGDCMGPWSAASAVTATELQPPPPLLRGSRGGCHGATAVAVGGAAAGSGDAGPGSARRSSHSSNYEWALGSVPELFSGGGSAEAAAAVVGGSILMTEPAWMVGLPSGDSGGARSVRSGCSGTNGAGPPPPRVHNMALSVGQYRTASRSRLSVEMTREPPPLDLLLAAAGSGAFGAGSGSGPQAESGDATEPTVAALALAADGSVRRRPLRFEDGAADGGGGPQSKPLPSSPTFVSADQAAQGGEGADGGSAAAELHRRFVSGSHAHSGGGGQTYMLRKSAAGRAAASVGPDSLDIPMGRGVARRMPASAGAGPGGPAGQMSALLASSGSFGSAASAAQAAGATASGLLASSGAILNSRGLPSMSRTTSRKVNSVRARVHALLDLAEQAELRHAGSSGGFTGAGPSAFGALSHQGHVGSNHAASSLASASVAATLPQSFQTATLLDATAAAGALPALPTRMLQAPGCRVVGGASVLTSYDLPAFTQYSDVAPMPPAAEATAAAAETTAAAAEADGVVSSILRGSCGGPTGHPYGTERGLQNSGAANFTTNSATNSTGIMATFLGNCVAAAPPAGGPPAGAPPPGDGDGEPAAGDHEQPLRSELKRLRARACTAVDGRRFLVLTMMDVTRPVQTQERVASLVEQEHRILEALFPRQGAAASDDEGGASKPGGSSRRAPGAALPPGGGGTSGGGGPLAALRAGRGRGAADGEAANSATRGHRQLRQLAMQQQLAALRVSQLATSHRMVTILFSDIVGFTSFSRQVAPLTVMRLLNELYKKLDAMLDIYKVYKVETIGDCYVVAGGLVRYDEDGLCTVLPEGDVDELHAVRVMEFAKAMLRASRTVALPTTGEPLQLRLGLHSGPAMSGVVGSKMPRFTVFGETVDTAHRMEAAGVPGRIHVSAASRALLGREEWAATEGVQIEGRGRMDTYLWVEEAEDDEETKKRVMDVYL